MRISRFDFFKLIGGGTAAASVASALPAPTMIVPAPVEPEVIQKHIKIAYDANDPRFYDVQPWIFYARFEPEDFQDETEVRLFSKGYMSCQLEMAETNMISGGCLHAPEQFALTGISVIVDRTSTQRQIKQFENNMTGAFRIAQKNYAEIFMPRVVVSSSLSELVQRDGEPTNFISSKVHRIDPPVSILSLKDFRLIMRRTPRYRVDIGGYGVLDGYLARGVQ
jgi:hypothetical protein